MFVRVAGFPRVLFLQQLQEAILERLVARLDSIYPAALANDLSDQLGYAIRSEAAECQPFALVFEVPEPTEAGAAGCRQPGHADANRPILSHDLRHRPFRDHPAVIYDRAPVADLLNLPQQVGVEKHRGAARLELPDDLADIVAPDRV